MLVPVLLSGASFFVFVFVFMVSFSFFFVAFSVCVFLFSFCWCLLVSLIAYFLFARCCVVCSCVGNLIRVIAVLFVCLFCAAICI